MLLGCGSTHQRAVVGGQPQGPRATRLFDLSEQRRVLTTTAPSPSDVRKWNVAIWNRAVWEAAIKRNQEAARAHNDRGVSAGGMGSRNLPTAPKPVVPSSIAAVMQCIKDHESGNYTESSHPSSGSGAYQYVPGTWQAWAARAGYPGYSYAYLAPAHVQDAVTVYTLTHGGAHNWDSSYGNDPCTEAMP